MKRFTQMSLGVLSMFYIFSCTTTKIIPLKGNYLHNQIEFKTEVTYDEVWTKTIEIFAKEGIGVKLIDKLSGLIIAESSSIILTTEGKDGKPINTKAYGIAPLVYYSGTNKFYHSKNGIMQWNVFVKKAQGNSTVVMINLVDITTNGTYETKGHYLPTAIGKMKAYSLGVFENELLNRIKQ